jgi:hypothetical protein
MMPDASRAIAATWTRRMNLRRRPASARGCRRSCRAARVVGGQHDRARRQPRKVPAITSSTAASSARWGGRVRPRVRVARRGRHGAPICSRARAPETPFDSTRPDCRHGATCLPPSLRRHPGPETYSRHRKPPRWNLPVLRRAFYSPSCRGPRRINHRRSATGVLRWARRSGRRAVRQAGPRTPTPSSGSTSKWPADGAQCAHAGVPQHAFTSSTRHRPRLSTSA